MQMVEVQIGSSLLSAFHVNASQSPGRRNESFKRATCACLNRISQIPFALRRTQESAFMDFVESKTADGGKRPRAFLLGQSVRQTGFPQPVFAGSYSGAARVSICNNRNPIGTLSREHRHSVSPNSGMLCSATESQLVFVFPSRARCTCRAPSPRPSSTHFSTPCHSHSQSDVCQESPFFKATPSD